MAEQAGADIGVAHLAESVLQRSESEFRRLLEKLPAGAYTCDPQGLITYFNQHAVRLWGREPLLNDGTDRFCGSFKLFATDGSPISHDRCWMALAIQQEQEFNGHEIVIERPDGQRLTALAHANPIHDEAGRLLGAVNVLVDISDRKRFEEALKEADRSKNEFLATLAHELRNPLAPIRNAVQLLRRADALPQETQWAVGVIDRQMTQMTRLVDDLLDIARITANRLELRQERLDLAEVVRAAVETSRPLIEASGHELEVSVPPQPLMLDGDLTRLAQVISNLLNNAAKYTDRGGRIWLTAERQASDAVVRVRDTGIGIPAARLPGIFEMFAQVEISPDRALGGLGIGLTLAKRLVDMHGGTVNARSEGPGKGSEFVVRLPLVVEPSPALPRSSHPHDPPASIAPLRILVVDDNRDSADSLALLLQTFGHEVRTAHDGLEAVDAASEFRPDVAVLDIGLPRMNGYETAREIRQQPWGRSMILVAATGWGQDADRERSKEAGFDHHLVKPLEPSALIRVLAASPRANPDGARTSPDGARANPDGARTSPAASAPGDQDLASR